MPADTHVASMPRTILERGTVRPETWAYDDIRANILKVYDPVSSARPSQTFDVLEAGGGSDNHLPLPSGARIATIDISADALAMNTYAHEKLLGDLETFDYGVRRFDLIIVWDVLEHLARPADALARLADVLKPEGRIVVVGPLTNSLKALITRWTPHAVHVFFYKRVLGVAKAGEPGWPPFRVEHATGAGADEVVALLDGAGLRIEAARGYESSHVAALAAKSRIALAGYRAAEWLLTTITFGRFVTGMTDFFVVARR